MSEKQGEKDQGPPLILIRAKITGFSGSGIVSNLPVEMNGCDVSGNYRHGAILQHPASTVTNSETSGNLGDGLRAPAGTTVANHVANNNGGHGINLTGVSAEDLLERLGLPRELDPAVVAKAIATLKAMEGLPLESKTGWLKKLSGLPAKLFVAADTASELAARFAEAADTGAGKALLKHFGIDLEIP